MPPQVNATILKVTGQGTADDWDRPAAAGADKWNGRVRAYYREATDRAVVENAVNVLVRRELILDVADLDLMGLDTDDTITFRADNASADDAGQAKAIRTARLAGVPRGLQTAKVTLDDR